MTIKTIPPECFESPTLKWQSKRLSNFAYSEDKVPLMVKILKTIIADSFFFWTKESFVCEEGKKYFVYVNSYGAVTAILPGGEMLGLKPDEFEVIEYHQ